MMDSLNELISNINNWKPEVGDSARLMGHWLKITKIDKSPFGKAYTLNCYMSGCCTVPAGIEMRCNFKDLKKMRKEFLKWSYKFRKDQNAKVRVKYA